MTRPLIIRGVNYFSVKHAADSIGVSAAAVSAALKKGSAENVGLGMSGNRDGANNRRETILKGVTYKSRQAAAESLGVSCPELSAFLRIAARLGIEVN